jgi:leucyl aminopeptidase (aminopeptidase T)
MGVPLDANGTFVADAAIGEWFGPRYKDLSEYPLRVEMENGRCRDASSTNQRLAREFLLYIRSNPNADRLGELSLGTNLGLRRFTGNAVIDENVPGCHIAIGDPLPELTGASWSSKTHVPLVGRDASIYLDDVPIMEDGQYPSELTG